MPSLDLFLYFQADLRVEKVAFVNGRHYSRCLEAWLALQDKKRAELMPIFKARASCREWHARSPRCVIRSRLRG